MVTTGSYNLFDHNHVRTLFEKAAEANLSTPQRKGCVIELPAQGQLLVTGDLHDHKDNYQKILKLAKLDAGPDRYLLLHELIHGEHLINKMDLSYRLLAQAAELKLRYPGQVHLILANHELAQVRKEGILKHGVSLVEAFQLGLEYLFGDRAESIHEAINRFILTMPLVIRCANGVMCSHSLPPPQRRAKFDPTVLDRELTEADLTGPEGSAYLMIWGRRIPQDWADELAAKWGVKVFLMGHQSVEMGFEECGDTMLVLNSHHQHGVALPVDLSRSYTRDQLMEEVIRLAGVLTEA